LGKNRIKRDEGLVEGEKFLCTKDKWFYIALAVISIIVALFTDGSSPGGELNTFRAKV
jgi:hypothetical protein